jgi:hypothetical protein
MIAPLRYSSHLHHASRCCLCWSSAREVWEVLPLLALQCIRENKRLHQWAVGTVILRSELYSVGLSKLRLKHQSSESSDLRSERLNRLADRVEAAGATHSVKTSPEQKQVREKASTLQSQGTRYPTIQSQGEGIHTPSKVVNSAFQDSWCTVQRSYRRAPC